MTSAPWTHANFRMPPEDNTRSPRDSSSSTGSQSPSSVTINAAAIKFSGSDTDYNPLYDRQPNPHGVNIEPPQWQKDPEKRDPISYVRGKKAIVKLDISGSPQIPTGRTISVKVTPSGALCKQIFEKDANGKLVKDAGKLVAEDATGVDPYPITFEPPFQTGQITNWTHLDYDLLSFTTNALPNTVRFDKLKIDWCFEYRYNEQDEWQPAGTERTEHETYITYSRSYEEFLPHDRPRPWKQVLRRACSYAYGTDTIAETATQVTTGIYDSLEFKYDGGDSHSEYDNSEIQLWDMMNQGWMDCRDGANYWTIMMRWLGINANQIKINTEDNIRDRHRITRVYNGFFYNTLRPISTSANNAGWLVRNLDVEQLGEDELGRDESNWWNFHQVGIVAHDPDDVANTTHVYDPIIMVNGGNSRVPVQMTTASYGNALFDPRPPRNPNLLRRIRQREITIIPNFDWDKPALVREVK